MTGKQRFGKWLIPKLPFNRRTFDVLRFELDAAVTTLLNVASIRIRRYRSVLSRQEHLNINLGSGGAGRSDWVNIDVRRRHRELAFPYDIRRGLPFRDGQVARIFAEHIIEHIEFREDLPRLMKECLRVLEAGGRLRIIVPDAERWLHAYVTGDSQEWNDLGFPKLPSDMPTAMTMINHVFHQGGEHQFAYDYETLKWVLVSAGFTKVSKMAYCVSQDRKICLDQLKHSKYSLYVEAQKQ